MKRIALNEVCRKYVHSVLLECKESVELYFHL